MKRNKFKDVDRLILYVKLNKVDKIVEHYKLLGWELVEKAENNKYEDLIDLTFERDHKIENKDELQLLQVYMEDKLNDIGKTERRKHAKSTAMSLVLGPLTLAAILCGLILIFEMKGVAVWVSAAVLFVFALINIILMAVFLPITIRREKNLFQERTVMLEAELDKICKQAKILLGEENGNIEKRGKETQN